MILKTVTITGADDSVRPRDLVALSARFPFVEWGILFSGTAGPRPRFPSFTWLEKLLYEREDALPEVHTRLSAHLCGEPVRDIVIHGKFSFRNRHPYLSSAFRRFQLNFHAVKHEAAAEHFLLFRNFSPRRVILQVDDVNDRILRDVLKLNEKIDWHIPVEALFDQSHGGGVLPPQWPYPIGGVHCGYSGGLGPDNVLGELERISRVTDIDTPIWIDMETKVRSEDDRKFDLDKTAEVLKSVALFINKTVTPETFKALKMELWPDGKP